jgi:hypothetical protein
VLFYSAIDRSKAMVVSKCAKVLADAVGVSSITERELQVAFLVRAGGMILFEFYLVLENVFAVSACKFNKQKRLILLVKFNFSPGCIRTSYGFSSF